MTLGPDPARPTDDEPHKTGSATGSKRAPRRRPLAGPTVGRGVPRSRSSRHRVPRRPAPEPLPLDPPPDHLRPRCRTPTSSCWCGRSRRRGRSPTCSLRECLRPAAGTATTGASPTMSTRSARCPVAQGRPAGVLPPERGGRPSRAVLQVRAAPQPGRRTEGRAHHAARRPAGPPAAGRGGAPARRVDRDLRWHVPLPRARRRRDHPRGGVPAGQGVRRRAVRAGVLPLRLPGAPSAPGRPPSR